MPVSSVWGTPRPLVVLPQCINSCIALELYLYKNAKTNFLPQNFLDYCAISVKNTNDKHRLILRFNSPSVHYVSKNKNQLRVRIDWEPDSISSYYE